MLWIWVKQMMLREEIYLYRLHNSKTNHISIDPSPFLPQTTIAMEKVKIAANAAHPIWKIMRF